MAGMFINNLFAAPFLPAFQHCSAGLSSGVYFGKYPILNVFLWALRNFSTFAPLWALAPSTNRNTLCHLPSSLSQNFRKAFWFFFGENMKTKACLLLAPNTFVYLCA